MTWVKVCGLKTPEDVRVAVAAGADAVGFVSYPGSPRYRSLDEIAILVRDVPATTVLLTVDMDVTTALEAAATTGVDGVQPYGRHAPQIVSAAVDNGLFVLDPIVATDSIVAHPGAIPLVDTPDEALYGGTGRSFDWRLVGGIDRDFVLAGGLGPHNVATAIEQVRPWGVDASSGLEAVPGRKDPGKVTDFVRKAKQA